MPLYRNAQGLSLGWFWTGIICRLLLESPTRIFSLEEGGLFSSALTTNEVGVIIVKHSQRDDMSCKSYISALLFSVTCIEMEVWIFQNCAQTKLK